MKQVVQIFTVLILLVGILQGCKKSIGNGSSNSGGGTTSPTDTTKMLAAPYYFTCNINGVAKSFATDAGCSVTVAANLIPGIVDSIYVLEFAMTGWIKTITSNITDSVESFTIGGASVRAASRNLFLGTYTSAYSSSSTGGCYSGNTVTVIGNPPNPTSYQFSSPGPDSSKSYPFSIILTAIDATTIRGTFNGVLGNYMKTTSSGTVTNNSSEKITNGAFYMPYSK